MATAAKESYAATHKHARISARKARFVIDLIRGLPVEKELVDLRFCLRRASPMISKVLRSAVANAEQASGLEPGSLFISKAIVGEGATMKRWRPRAMGRAYPRTKRTCHIRVEVSEMTGDMRPAAPEKSEKPEDAKKAAKRRTPAEPKDAAKKETDTSASPAPETTGEGGAQE